MVAALDVIHEGTGEVTSLAPRFVMGLDDLRHQVMELDRFKESVMQKGTDYDVIPGTPKPSLLKPGAEKLAMIFGLRPEFKSVREVQDWQGGFFYYQVDCRLVSRHTGETVGNGLGTCNTKEGRYRWRNARPACPSCGMELFKSKVKPEWFCWQKKGGCGTTAPFTEIAADAGGRMENDDPYTLDNTVLKMAQKRALVAAVLVATAASGIFTQDVEDYADVAARSTAPRTTPAVSAPDDDDDRMDAIEAEYRETQAKPAATAKKKATTEQWARWMKATALAGELGIAYKPLPNDPDALLVQRWTERLEGLVKQEQDARSAAAQAFEAPGEAAEDAEPF